MVTCRHPFYALKNAFCASCKDKKITLTFLLSEYPILAVMHPASNSCDPKLNHRYFLDWLKVYLVWFTVLSRLLKVFQDNLEFKAQTFPRLAQTGSKFSQTGSQFS